MKEHIIKTCVQECSYDELSDTYKKLIDEAKSQTQKAYAPYSHFHVGAAMLLGNGEIMTGSNQENAAYPSGLCAERTTMFYANAKYPDVPIKALAIAGFTANKFTETPTAPCGACRQALLEAEVRFNTDITILLYGTKNIYIISSIKSLLPLSFKKESLKGN